MAHWSRPVRCLIALFTLALLAGLSPFVSPAYSKYTEVAHWNMPGELTSSPEQIAIDSADNVFVGDRWGDRVLVFSPGGSLLRSWDIGDPDASFDEQGQLAGIAVDDFGHVYVSYRDPSRIRKFSTTGTLMKSWGATGEGSGEINQPEGHFGDVGLTTDSAGNVYAADPGNNRMQKFSPNGTFLKAWGSTGTGNGQFREPQGVATDSANNLYVNDSGNDRIQKFSPNGAFIKAWNQGEYSLGALATDSEDNVYSTVKGISKYSPDGGFITHFQASELTVHSMIAVDSVGNAYTNSLLAGVVLKYARVPGLTITSGPKGKTSKRSPTFQFSSDEPDTSFQCRLDRRSWEPCSSPKSYTGLGPGKHTFRVRGTGSNGNAGDSAERSFKVGGTRLTVQKLKVKGRRALLTIDCPLTTRCSGTIGITGRVKKRLLGSRRGGSRKIRMIKTTRYRVRAGGSKKYRLRLTRPARKALKKSRRLVGTATLKAGNGKKAKFKAVIKR